MPDWYLWMLWRDERNPVEPFAITGALKAKNLTNGVDLAVMPILLDVVCLDWLSELQSNQQLFE